MKRAAFATLYALVLLAGWALVFLFHNLEVANEADARIVAMPSVEVAQVNVVAEIADDEDDDEAGAMDTQSDVAENVSGSWAGLFGTRTVQVIRFFAPRGAVEDDDDEPAPVRRASMEEICATLQAVADEHELPLPFFVRLIWQESRFRTDVVSRAGARGIAQFMPRTAALRGLADPNDPIQALHHSAGYLSELRDQFGNLGLAAAAYNGGSGRVEGWLKGRRKLPGETRAYVRIVTGMPAEQWRKEETATGTERIPTSIPCPTLAAIARQQVEEQGPEAKAGAESKRRVAVKRSVRKAKANGRLMARNQARSHTSAQPRAQSARQRTVVKGRNAGLATRVAARGPGA